MNVIKSNNDKYITKIGTCEQKITRVLTETESIISQYKKKIGGINKNLESTRQLREELYLRVDKCEMKTTKQDEFCRETNAKNKDHIDHLTLHYKEDIIDLKVLSQGFARELDRVNVLFRELQTEFLVTLEEKRTHNEQLLGGIGLNEK